MVHVLLCADCLAVFDIWLVRPSALVFLLLATLKVFWAMQFSCLSPC